MESVQGKVAFLTGASSGIGAAAAVAFAGAGMKVAISARTQAGLNAVAAQCRAAGAAEGDVLTFSLDVTDRDAVLAAVASTVERFGRLDVLVASAGTNIKRRNFAEADLGEMAEVLDTNINGVFYAAKAALEPMKHNGGGLMILVGSMASRRHSTVTGPAYTASKHALNGLGSALSAEEQKNGIRVTVLSPGVVNTPIMQKRPNPPAADALNTMAIQPEDTAELLLFLAQLHPRCTIPVVDIVPTVFPPQ